MITRPINQVMLHCTATKPSQKVTVEDIDRWHKERGWKQIGYHFVIDRSGKIHAARPMDVKGAHAFRYNYESLGVCYIGGVDKEGEPEDNMTKAQEKSFRHLYESLCTVFDKKLELKGHNDVSSKACPSFDVKTKFSDLYD